MSKHMPADRKNMSIGDEAAARRLRRRRAEEARFRFYGVFAISLALGALLWLLTSIVGSGYTAFYQHKFKLTIELDEATLDPSGARDADALRRANYRGLLQAHLAEQFPEASDRRARRELLNLLSVSGASDQLRQAVYGDPNLVGQTLSLWVPTSDDVDQLLKGYIKRDTPEALRRVSDRQIAWIDQLVEAGEIRSEFNLAFFTVADSRDAELAGIAGALAGSALALLVAFALSFPIGVGAALYLEEFAPKNRLTEIIEVNINNLAAVPSIVFGLLGVAVLLQFFGMPRSAPLAGGMVLALMTLPTIIISTRASLKAAPASLREGAMALGASKVQTVFHHVLPVAAPGILTGSILGMAQALGETAPLLMIGMVAFITEVPSTLTEPATALPVQIYLWSDHPERAWAERTSAAIIVLLIFLMAMNLVAIWLRNRFERRW